MHRLDARRARIAAAPVSLAAVALAVKMIGIGDGYPGFHSFGYGMPSFGGIPVTLFLSACLIFAPRFPTSTEKILTVISIIMLASGLLPGTGFSYVFTMIQYLLFAAVATGLGIDFYKNGDPLKSSAAPAHE
jgi:hypothetical protein